jgi:hypothetical protein
MEFRTADFELQNGFSLRLNCDMVKLAEFTRSVSAIVVVPESSPMPSVGLGMSKRERLQGKGFNEKVGFVWKASIAIDRSNMVGSRILQRSNQSDHSILLDALKGNREL